MPVLIAYYWFAGCLTVGVQRMNDRAIRQLTQEDTRNYFLSDIIYAKHMRQAASQKSAAEAVIRDGSTLLVLGIIYVAILILGILVSAFHSADASSAIGCVFIMLLVVGLILYFILERKNRNHLDRKLRYGCRIMAAIGLFLSTIGLIEYSSSTTAKDNAELISLIGILLFCILPIFCFFYAGTALSRSGRRQLREGVSPPPLPPIPTDAEFDRWLENRVNQCLVETLRRQGLDGENIDPRKILRVRGYVLPGMREAHHYKSGDLLSRRGRDNKWHYSVNRYTYFYPAEHLLMIFKYSINAMNWRDFSEEVENCFYNDITGITTEDHRDVIYVNGNSYNYQTKRFCLRIADGRTISAATRSRPTDIWDLPEYDNDIPDSEIDRTSAQILMYVRSKKGKW
jgi:uncharacterized membrane protein